MREMKDSGVEWIGEIPVRWQLSQTRRLFRNEKRVVGDAVDEYERLALTLNGVIKRSKEDNEGLQPEKFEGYQILRENELVFKMIDLENVNTSRVGLSPYTGLVSPAYIVLTNDSDDNRFAYYWFMSMYYQEVFNNLGGAGVRSALNAKDMLSMPIPNITSEEQKQIADYLDSKCAKIDSIIDKQQAIIEKIKEYKLALITDVVTHGIHKCEFKDTGNTYIGKIPKDWNVVRLKFLLDNLVDCPHETPTYSDEGEYYVVRTADQDYARLRPDEFMYRLTEEEYHNRIRRLSLDKDDIVYGREGGRWGIACLIPESGKYCLGQRMLQFRCNKAKFIPEFAVYALSSKLIYLQGSFDTMGSASPHVNISTVQNYNIVIPSIEEQKEIVNYLTQQCEKLHKEIETREKMISKMEEYKKSLIYEVVTGKKEV